MDRVSILKALIDGTYGGSQADFARAIKRSPAQVNQWLQGVRMIGDASARHIENTLNLGGRYFDGAPATPARATGPAITTRKQVIFDLIDGLTERQQDEVIRLLTDQKQSNDSILDELTRRRA